MSTGPLRRGTREEVPARRPSATEGSAPHGCHRGRRDQRCNDGFPVPCGCHRYRPGADIKDSDCFSGTWQGEVKGEGMQRLYEDTSVEGLTPWQSRGTYEMCTTVLKVIEPPRDGDPRYDYYAVRVQTRWSNDPGAWHGDRQGGRVTIRSNWEARVKDASGDLVDTNCTELPLAVAFKFVSLSSDCSGPPSRVVIG